MCRGIASLLCIPYCQTLVSKESRAERFQPCTVRTALTVQGWKLFEDTTMVERVDAHHLQGEIQGYFYLQGNSPSSILPGISKEKVQGWTLDAFCAADTTMIERVDVVFVNQKKSVDDLIDAYLDGNSEAYAERKKTEADAAAKLASEESQKAAELSKDIVKVNAASVSSFSFSTCRIGLTRPRFFQGIAT